jgi:hypothetical protein
MNSLSGIEVVFTVLVWVAVLILTLRVAMKTHRLSVRILAFALGVFLTAVVLWNTAIALRF